MKKYFMFLLVILFLSFFSNSNAFTSLDCYPDSVSCESWIIDTMNINLPSYPNCTIEIEYKHRHCPQPLGYQVYIERINFIANWECIELTKCIWPYEPDRSYIDWFCLRSLWREAYRQLTYNFFLNNITKNWTDAQKDEYLCGSDNFIETNYFRGACAFTCVGYDQTNNNKYLITENLCTPDLCCQTTRKFCFNKIWDSDLQKWFYFPVVTEVRTTQVVQNCDEIQPLLPPNCFSHTECYSVCDEDY